MKILWICSQPLNIIAKQLNLPNVVFGGWMEGIALHLSKNKDLDLFYLFFNESHNSLNIYKVNNIQFVDFGTQDLNFKIIKNKIEFFNQQEHFDIIHVFGTENKMINRVTKQFSNKHVIVSIQGILSEIVKVIHTDLFKYHRFRNIVSQYLACQVLNINQLQFFQRSLYEKDVLKKFSHYIGRTSWDHQVINKLSPNAKYHHNYEILRSNFYVSSKWDIQNIKKYHIFVSQGSYPLKGLHFVLKAVALLKQEFPNIQLIVAGENLLNNSAITARLGISYSNFIEYIIQSEKIQNSVRFTGALDATQMINELLMCNVFVMASTLENSPNSLGEAMILGVPCVSSRVGGIPSLVNDKIDCLLFDVGDAIDLSNQIRKIFIERELDLRLSKAAIVQGNKIFDPTTNINQLIHIYQSMLN